jgi:hypothetical protein
MRSVGKAGIDFVMQTCVIAPVDWRKFADS